MDFFSNLGQKQRQVYAFFLISTYLHTLTRSQRAEPTSCPLLGRGRTSSLSSLLRQHTQQLPFTPQSLNVVVRTAGKA